MIRRESLPDGTVELHSPGCTFTYRRLKPGALLVTITGDDKGDFGTAPLDELTLEITRYKMLSLYVDTRAVRGAAASVTDEWTAWFSANEKQLSRVAILATSKFVHLIVSIAKLFSRTGEMIRIYSDEQELVACIARDVPGFTKLPPPARS